MTLKKCMILTAFALFSSHFGVDAQENTTSLQCTVVIDETSGDVLHRDGICDKAFSPMSTFKLPLAMMGYDAGILIDAENPSWDYKPEFDGSKREQKTTNPTIWEKESIVWYSQEITRKLGKNRFDDYVQRFGYGNKDTAGDAGKNNGLTRSWLMSSLAIAPDEQVRFLRRFLRGELPVSETAMDMTMAIVPHFDAGDWDVQGKTGSGWMRDGKGRLDKSRQIGWFVGWAMRDERRVIFARLTVGPKQGDTFAGLEAREALLRELPQLAASF